MSDEAVVCVCPTGSRQTGHGARCSETTTIVMRAKICTVYKQKNEHSVKRAGQMRGAGALRIASIFESTVVRRVGKLSQNSFHLLKLILDSSHPAPHLSITSMGVK